MTCSGRNCSEDAVWRVFEIRNRTMLRGDDALCEKHARLLWTSYLSENREGSGEVCTLADGACFELELVLADYRGQKGKVLLREVGHKRLFFCPIGFVEVCELYYAAQESPYNEFTLHIAMKSLVEHLGGTLSHVIVDHLHPAGYFEAKAIVIHNQKMIKLRIRPSDGLILALLAKLPFLVTEEVLKRIAEGGDVERW